MLQTAQSAYRSFEPCGWTPACAQTVSFQVETEHLLNDRASSAFPSLFVTDLLRLFNTCSRMIVNNFPTTRCFFEYQTEHSIGL